LYLARSASSLMATMTASPVIGPLVPGVYASGAPINGVDCGSSICAEVGPLDALDVHALSAQMLEPQPTPLIGAPLAYTPGTNGPITGDAVIVAINDEADLAKYKGTLKGKMVLLGPGRDLQMSLQPLALRRSDADLAALAQAPDGNPNAQRPPGAAAIGGGGRQGGPGGGQQFQRALNRFLAEEGVAVAVRVGGGRSEGGTVFAQGGGTRDPKDPVPSPMVTLTPEHFNRIARLLDHRIPVKLQFDIDARFIDDRNDSVNVVGEIPGDASVTRS